MKQKREASNKFKCLVCGKEALRGKYVITKSGPFKGLEGHVCREESCQKQLSIGSGWTNIFKFIASALFIVLSMGCAKTTVGTATAASYKSLQHNDWTISEPGVPFDRNSVPFYRIILVNQVYEVLSLPTSNGCDSSMSITGSDNSGFLTIATSDDRPECTAYNGQTVTYQRIDDLTMKFCIGSYCANYQ